MNRFRIVVRGADPDPGALEERLSRVSSLGIPNYFGAQRFGRDCRNLELAEALFGGRRLKRQQRSIAISAARSLIFNEILAERVRNETWNTAMPGDCFILDGTNSVFGPEQINAETRRRIEEMDIHPAGPLWGDGDQRPLEAARDVETQVIARLAEWADGLSAAGAKIARRALRSRVRELKGEVRNQDVIFSLSLATGTYATSFLREVGSIDA
jgi:tRNA pseudouridine13 synthase